MKKDVKIYLNHILESIELIEEYTKNKTEDEFFTSKILQDAVIKKIRDYRGGN
ncbi:HepT-like ribonuclease domain-containing protein [Methanocaldococcus infernus]